MTVTNLLSNRKNLIAVTIAVVVILFPLGYSMVSHVAAGSPDEAALFLERPDEKFTDCVRDVEYMRHHHWELLRGVREEVVRYGIRGEIGLNQCRNCHTSRERFCDRCHHATSLTPDCFGCHYYP